MRRLAWAGVFALIFACLAFLVAAPSYAWSRYAVLDETATWLASGREVHVRCLTPEESDADFVVSVYGAAAYVEGWRDRQGNWHPYAYTVLAFGNCGPLLVMPTEDWSGVTVEDIAWAVLVLTHESGHLRGHRWSADEALTQRWALRHFVYVAMRLGASETQARMLLRFAVEWHMKLPYEYRARGCREPWVDEVGQLRDCK